MGGNGQVKVRIFGLLRQACAESGRPTNTTVEVAEGGVPAHVIALELGLPLDMIEGVFVNHTVYALNKIVEPGDEIAFVPYGTPGPHRFYLGLYKAGQEAGE